MEEVKHVSDNVADGDSNNISNNLDSNNAISTATANGDRDGKGSDHEASGDDVRRRSKDRRDRSRSRSRSKERSRKHKRRHRSRDRDRDHDRKRRSRSKDRDDEDEKSSRRDKDRDRDRRRRSRSRDRDRHRRSSRDRDRDRHRDRRDRDRDRDRRRSRSSSSEYRERRRREARERDRSEERRAERRRERQAERERKEKEEESSGKITLRDVLTQNPGISVPDALQRMHAINTAVANGTAVPPIAIPAGEVGSLVNPAGIPGATVAMNAQMQFAATKVLREIYVGNIPPQITIPQLTEFVNEAMKQLGLSQPSAFGGPVVTCWISTDAHYAFIELRTVEEATAALTGLSGISCGGYNLRVGRPKTGAPGAAPVAGIGGVQPLGMGQVVAPVSYGVGTVPAVQPVALPTQEASNVIMVANLPDSIGEAQVRELLSPFGAIKLFNFIKVPMGGGTGGAAVLEYEDPSVGAGAIAGLNGLAVGEKQLSVQSVPANMASLLLKPTSSTTPTASATPTAPKSTDPVADSDPLDSLSPTAVLRMSNMVSVDELKDDELHEELQEDIADECNQHGTVRSIIIPRPVGDVSGPGVGEVFVCFTHSEGASKAKNAVHGRTFNGLSVKAVFYPEDLFHSKVYALPNDYVVGGTSTTALNDDAMD